MGRGGRTAGCGMLTGPTSAMIRDAQFVELRLDLLGGMLGDEVGAKSKAAIREGVRTKIDGTFRLVLGGSAGGYAAAGLLVVVEVPGAGDEVEVPATAAGIAFLD